MKSATKTPETVGQALEALDEVLSDDDKKVIIRFAESEVIKCHMGLGRWIRNNWGLWSGGPLFEHMKSLGFIHPDDMSMSLIREWWARKNNRPSIMQDEIKRYAEYWEKNK